MDSFNRFLLIAHFVGLAMGFAVTFSSLVMKGLIAKAAPPDRAVLARFMPLMGRVGLAGLSLLWASGAALWYLRWRELDVLGWQFAVKIVAVALLTLIVLYLHALQPRATRGDTAAEHRIQSLGPMASLMSITALVFAVLAFD